MMKKFFFITQTIVLCSVLFACGYTTRSTLRSDLKTIAVELFKNDIDLTKNNGDNVYLPLLEVNIRNAIISKYQFDGNLKITKKEDADLILTGTLKNYSRDVLRYTDNDDNEEYRVRITVSLELYDNIKQEIVWTENNFSGEEDYFAIGPKATSEDSAVKGAEEDLAKRIVERTIEAW